MKPAFLFYAGVVTIPGFVLLWLRSNSRKGANAMAATETCTAAAAARAAPGTLVELKGTIRCENPILSDFTNTPSVYFRSRIEEEVRYQESGSNGSSRTTTRTDVVSRIQRQVPFFVEDASGAMLVRCDKADVEAVSVYDERRPPVALGGGGVSTWNTSDRRRVWKEWSLSPGSPVYVLGTVQQDGSIGPAPPSAPPESQVFIISYKTEEQQQRDAFWGQIATLCGAGIAFGLSLWMLWYGLK